MSNKIGAIIDLSSIDDFFAQVILIIRLPQGVRHL